MATAQNVKNMNTLQNSLNVKKITQTVKKSYPTELMAINSAFGAFSKEDLKFIHFYKKILPNLFKIKRIWVSFLFKIMGPDYRKKINPVLVKDWMLASSLNESLFLQDFKTAFKLDRRVHDKKPEYIMQSEEVTPKTARKIKRKFLKNYAIEEKSYENSPESPNLPYSAWFNTNLGTPNYLIGRCETTGLENKILLITGELNKKDIEKQEKYAQSCANKSFDEILKCRFKVMNELKSLYDKGNADIMGNFSAQEIREMKDLVIKSLVLGRIIKKQGVNIADLENIMYTKTGEYKIGNFIDGLGLIIDKMNVNGKPVIITTVKDGMYLNFCMYDLNALKNRDEFIENIPKCITDIKRLNSSARILSALNVSNAPICKISSKIIQTADTYIKFNIDKTNKEAVQSCIDQNEYAYIISNFENFKKHDYPSAARILGVRLLKTLNEHNPNYPVFLTAVKERSPASMYLRMGFKPLSKSEEYVKENMSKNLGEYKDPKSLDMYAPSIKSMSEKLKLFENLYFSNTESLHAPKQPYGIGS